MVMAIRQPAYGACWVFTARGLHGFSCLVHVEGYLYTNRKPAGWVVSKNIQARREVDRDFSNELFDTKAGPVAGVARLSKKRADTVGEF
jgi:hypothetical protein